MARIPRTISPRTISSRTVATSCGCSSPIAGKIAEVSSKDSLVYLLAKFVYSTEIKYGTSSKDFFLSPNLLGVVLGREYTLKVLEETMLVSQDPGFLLKYFEPVIKNRTKGLVLQFSTGTTFKKSLYIPFGERESSLHRRSGLVIDDLTSYECPKGPDGKEVAKCKEEVGKEETHPNCKCMEYSICPPCTTPCPACPFNDDFSFEVFVERMVGFIDPKDPFIKPTLQENISSIKEGTVFLL